MLLLFEKAPKAVMVVVKPARATIVKIAKTLVVVKYAKFFRSPLISIVNHEY